MTPKGQQSEGLFPISGCDNPNRLVDVVFVHGLGGDWRSTWHPKKEEDKFWPEWLGKDFPDVGVWSLGYEASPSEWFGRSMPIHDRASNALQHLRVNGLSQRRLIFVTHSLGGLLVKRMLRHAHDLSDPILSRTERIFFLATPHTGARLATFLRNWFSWLLRLTPLAHELVAAAPELRDLNGWYRNNVRRLKIKTEVFYEKRGWFGRLVVPEDIADPGLEGVDPIATPDTHTSICKFTSRDHIIYKSVKAFLQDRVTTPPSPVVGKVPKIIAPPDSATKPWIAPWQANPFPPTRLHVTGTLFKGRDEETALLDRAWASGDSASGVSKTDLVQIVAQGGAGKTALALVWRNCLGAGNWRGAQRVFDYSFYSQGASDRSAANSEDFFAKALEFFGEPKPEELRNPWTKGERLAALVAERRTLLILDGLEPLQHPPGPLAGHLKDEAVKTLLLGLAQKNPGLCIVTTREDVADLAPNLGYGVVRHELKQLSEEAGEALLRELDVKGTEDEIRAVVKEFQGHALALNLLGNFIRAATNDRHISNWQRIRDEGGGASALLRQDATEGEHARHMLAAYERWFAEKTPRLLAVLRMLSLFDGPADADCLVALRNGPAIPGLTDNLGNRTYDALNRLLTQLEDLRLIARTGKSRRQIDSHPVLRDYFADQLRDKHPEAWKAAHSRLFDHLRDATKPEFPDTLEGLLPLYNAIAHGCKAGRHQEALDEVYYRRILRGEEFFSTKKLGAFGAELSALAQFFDRPWSQVAKTLTPPDQAFLLNAAAFALRAQGRLSEAVEPRRAGLEARVAAENWQNAAISANNLSELHLTLGQVGEAVRLGEECVAFADRSGGARERIINRPALADALHQAGRRDEAAARFVEAERMQKEQQPEYPLLYSTRGFQYCDLLLSEAEDFLVARRRGAGSSPSEPPSSSSSSPATAEASLARCREVRERADKTLGWARIGEQGSLLDIALDHLTLARANALDARLLQLDPSFASAKSGIESAAAELEAAVAGLRRAGHQDYLPRGLLVRADFRAWRGDWTGAETDLTEVETLAERGGMRLFQTDAHLLRAWWHIQRGSEKTPEAERDAERAKARKHFEAAAELVKATGYHRRDFELGVLGNALRG